MNREQAENILAAYVVAVQDGIGDEARDALHDVILDAMTSVRYYPYINYPTVNAPTVDPYKPTVTCTTESASYEAVAK